MKFWKKLELKVTLLFTLISLISLMEVSGQSTHKQLRDADKAYKSGNYTQAEDNYRKTWIEKQNTKGGFNLGNSIYQQQDRYEEAVNQYESIAENAQDQSIKSKAYYNLGNAHFQNQAFDKSVDAYKKALRLDNQDEDIRKNLMTAMQRLQQQQQQMQQQQQQQQEEKEKEEEQEENQQQQQQQNQEQEQQPQQQEQESEETRDLNKEEAEQLLKIIEQEEQKVQEKLRKASASDKKPKKKW